MNAVSDESKRGQRRRKKRTPATAKAQQRRDLLAELEAVDRIRQRTWANFGLIASLAIGGLVVVKVVVVSRGNTQTALALISGASAAELLFGIFVAGIWGIVAAFSTTLVIFAQRAEELSPQEELRLWSIFAIVLFVFSFAAPWWIPAQFLVLGITFRVMEWMWARKGGDVRGGERTFSWEAFKSVEPKDSELHQIWERLIEIKEARFRTVQGAIDLSEAAERQAQYDEVAREWQERHRLLASKSRNPLDLVLVGLLILLLMSAMPTLLNDQPWLPTERIVIDGGDATVGYVVGSSSEWVTVLLDDNREIQYVLPSSVEERVMCRTGDLRPRQDTIWQLLSGERGEAAQYPECN